MSVSKQHQLRGFGQTIVGGKQSQSTGFEDDDDVSPIKSPQKPAPAVEVSSLIIPQIEKPPQPVPSARQKKLEEITEVEGDHEEHKMPAKQDSPLAPESKPISLVVESRIVQMVESSADKELQNLITALES